MVRGVEGMMRKLLREELGKVMKKIREMKSWREEVRLEGGSERRE